MNDRYFTERLFWLPRSNTLLHVFFMHGHGWYSSEEFDFGYVGKILVRKEPTYLQLMQHYAHEDPQLLLQEEW